MVYFAMAGLIVAYFQFRKKRDGLISTAMEPVFGEAYKRPFRNIIDILAIIATVMGIATSIGLGIMQISGGLNHVFHVPNNNITKISITVLMMIIFIGSGITGLGRGVKWLSNLNIILGALLLVFMLIFGDLKFIFESYTLAIGDYIRHFVEYSLRMIRIQITMLGFNNGLSSIGHGLFLGHHLLEVSLHVYHAVAPFENLLCVCL